jgi:riboflavin kinase/FMN adenylyltransferase
LVLEELSQITHSGGTAVTIGVFDGVHLGHQQLIRRTVEAASQRGLQSLVVTFRNHPRTVLTPGFKPQYLTGIDERVRLLKSLGVDHVAAISFSREISQLRAREFVSLLRKHGGMELLVVGPDFAMGKNREGDVPTLTALGHELGFDVITVEFAQLEGREVSSTSIREALTTGDVSRALSYQGRPFSLTGLVVGGEKRGQVLGFPTANVDVEETTAVPADGIYATRAIVDGACHDSATYIGTRPTFEQSNRVIEVFILDFQGDLYGRQLTIEFIDRIRGDMTFANPDELIAQMEKDVAQAQEVLDGA